VQDFSPWLLPGHLLPSMRSGAGCRYNVDIGDVFALAMSAARLIYTAWCCALQVVYVGERVVDHNPAFKLYLVTRNANPSLTPDVEPLLTVTNFSITRSGLESRYKQ